MSKMLRLGKLLPVASIVILGTMLTMSADAATATFDDTVWPVVNVKYEGSGYLGTALNVTTVSRNFYGGIGVYSSINRGNAIEGRVSGGGYGVYSDGPFAASGTKSAVVPTSRGATELYTEEAADVWFTDYGEGQLSNGHSHVDVDPAFLETVTIDKKHPAKVFVQLLGEANGVYIQRGETGFEVIELNNGHSNAGYMYRIVAKRKGYEDVRLAKAHVKLGAVPDFAQGKQQPSAQGPASFSTP